MPHRRQGLELAPPPLLLPLPIALAPRLLRGQAPAATCSNNIMIRTEHPINEKVGKYQSPLLTH